MPSDPVTSPSLGSNPIKHGHYTDSYGPVFGAKLEAAHSFVEGLEAKLAKAKLALHELHQQANQDKDHPQPLATDAKIDARVVTPVVATPKAKAPVSAVPAVPTSTTTTKKA